MPVVLLVRHGQASFGAQDYDVLSELGQEQSRVVGDELARRQLREPLVASGGLRRQRDTAVLAGLGEDLRTDARLDEYDHLGLLERYVPDGAFSDSRGMQDLLDAALGAWTRDPVGGWASFAGGAAEAVDELAAAAGRGRDAVAFTSGGVVAAVCAQLLGGGADAVVALNRVAANAAVTKLVVGRSGTTLMSYNDHAHFEGDRRELLTYR